MKTDTINEIVRDTAIIARIAADHVIKMRAHKASGSDLADWHAGRAAAHRADARFLFSTIRRAATAEEWAQIISIARNAIQSAEILIDKI